MGEELSFCAGDKVKSDSAEDGDKWDSIGTVQSSGPQQSMKENSSSDRQRKKLKKSQQQTQSACVAESLQEENNSFREKNGSLLKQCQHLQQELEKQSQTQRHLQQELDRTLTKCSQLASEKLLSSSTLVKELDVDRNSPEILAERFHSELYSNKWCDAFEALVNYGLDEEKEIVPLLADICLECWVFCNVKTRSDLQQLVRLLGICDFSVSPGEDCNQVAFDISSLFTKLPEAVKNEFRNCKFNVTKNYLDEMFQELISHSVENHTFLGIMNSSFHCQMRSYVTLCLELSLKMSVQDICLHFKEIEGSLVNTDVYEFYSNTGSRVQYVVWPVIYRLTDGRVLRKGIIKALAS